MNLNKLEQAKRLLEEVRDTLNNDRRECDCCGLTVYAKQDEWLQWQMLGSAIGKIEKIISEVKRK